MKKLALKLNIQKTKNQNKNIKKNKKTKNQINKIRNENGEITTDNTEIQRIIREYYEQLYTNKRDNLQEMDRFLEKFNFPRLNQEEIKIMSKPATNTEIEIVIKK